jgi:hypothetical protein
LSLAIDEREDRIGYNNLADNERKRSLNTLGALGSKEKRYINSPKRYLGINIERGNSASCRNAAQGRGSSLPTLGQGYINAVMAER